MIILGQKDYLDYSDRIKLYDITTDSWQTLPTRLDQKVTFYSGAGLGYQAVFFMFGEK